MTGSVQRFTHAHPCPVCGGYEEMPRGRSERCWGYLSDDGHYARCTRPDWAGSLGEQRRDLVAPRRRALSLRSPAHRLAGKLPQRVIPPPPLRQRQSAGTSEHRPRARIVATYDYRDTSGVLRYQVCRYHPKGFKPAARGARTLVLEPEGGRWAPLPAAPARCLRPVCLDLRRGG